MAKQKNKMENKDDLSENSLDRSWGKAKKFGANSFSSGPSDMSAVRNSEKKGGLNDWERRMNIIEREKDRFAKENKENVEAIKSLNCYNDWTKAKMIQEMKHMPKANPT